MTAIGYALSSEEHRPLDLVRYARKAETCGFEFALVSDHYHPWIDRQGQSSFVWSVVGGIAAATDSLRLGTGVTCPTIRLHPAIVAQAAATAADMMPGRFFLGVGTGENLNEHILGDRWPSASERLEMLEEALRSGKPEVFNTDRGVQFTAAAFTGCLEGAGVAVSMDGRGRALDNVFVERLWRSVKYEDIYIRGYEAVPELDHGLGRYFALYNDERPHQSLGYRTPAAVYREVRGMRA